MGKTIALSVDLENMNIDKEISRKINLIEVLPEAKKQLAEYYDVLVTVINNNFTDDRWIFKYRLNSEKHTFDFGMAKKLILFGKHIEQDEFINVLKCWVAFKLNERGIETVRICLYDILSASFASNCFNKSMKDSFISKLKENKIYRLKQNKKEFIEKEVSDNTINIYCRNLIDFLTFYDNTNYLEYIENIYKIKSKTKIVTNTRSIPPYGDVLKFKKYIEYWIEHLNEIDKNEYIKFFPVYFWWEVTTIIPMRPSEICIIKKDCLSYDGQYYYLTFPRIKRHRKGENRLQEMYDTLPIPKVIYERINKFIDISKDINKSDYLFDFSAFKQFTEESELNFEVDDEEMGFTNLYLLELLGKFYKEVIHEKYNVNIKYVKGHYKNMFFNDRKSEYKSFNCFGNDSIDEMLRPGDLRHIAILNMFLQGYDPVEIQRLAGHIHEETQMGYQMHMQYWIDSQIQQLANDFSTYNITPENFDYKITIDPKAVENYKKLYKKIAFLHNNMKVEDIEEEQKLEIGFCNDETMPCPTFNWRHSGCYFCKNWGITEIELEEKQDKILRDMSLIYDQLRDKVNFMKSLSNIQLNEYGEYDLQAKEALSRTSKEVQEGITNIATIMSMLGVKND